MKHSNSSEIEDLQFRLAKCRSIAAKHEHLKDKKPLIYQQVEFWIESARFCITELQIWKSLADERKYEETRHQAERAFSHLNDFIGKLLE